MAFLFYGVAGGIIVCFNTNGFSFAYTRLITMPETLEHPECATDGNELDEITFEQEPELQKMHVYLMREIRTYLCKEELSQKQAADLFDVAKSDITKLKEGKGGAFDVITLMKMIDEAGAEILTSIDWSIAGNSGEIT